MSDDFMNSLGSIVGKFTKGEGIDASAVQPEALTGALSALGIQNVGPEGAQRAMDAVQKNPDVLATLMQLIQKVTSGGKVDLSDIPKDAIQKAISIITAAVSKK